MTTITLPYPPSLNTYWRSVRGRVLISAKGRSYRTLVAQAIMLARKSGDAAAWPILDRLAVRIDASPPDRRKRDLDNVTKALLDALTHAGVWLDDSQIDDLRIVRQPHTSGGQVLVTVTPIDSENREERGNVD